VLDPRGRQRESGRGRPAVVHQRTSRLWAESWNAFPRPGRGAAGFRRAKSGNNFRSCEQHDRSRAERSVPLPAVFVPPARPCESRCSGGSRRRGFQALWPLSVTVLAVTCAVKVVPVVSESQLLLRRDPVVGSTIQNSPGPKGPRCRAVVSRRHRRQDRALAAARRLGNKLSHRLHRAFPPRSRPASRGD
jgi:hypothetical protein